MKKDKREKTKKQKKKTLWYPLDNAAKIYPPTASIKRAHVFCFSAFLNDEIDPEILCQAVENIFHHYKTFKTKLMRGMFWYYLEENSAKFKVFQEEPYYLKSIDYRRNNDYLFEVLYIRNKITVKFFHALTDGTGGFKFFSSLLAEYLTLCGNEVDLENVITPVETPHTFKDSDDSFKTYHTNTKDKPEKIKKPYHINATPFEYDGPGIITAKANVSKIKAIASEKNVTITAFLAGIYMHSIYKSFLKNKPLKNKIVTVLIPCNLRKKYGGETLRNFSMFARFTNDYNQKVPTLDELFNLCQAQLDEGLTTDKLDSIIHDNVKTESNFFIKIAPRPIKDVIMRIAYSKVGEVLQTVDFSNVGKVNLPECFKKFVNHITFAITPTYSCNHQTGVISYNDNLYITFARNFVETEIEKNFVRKLADYGIDVEIRSNYWEVAPWKSVNIAT